MIKECPKCESENIEPYDQIAPNVMDRFNDSALHKMKCNDCSTTWDNVYKLVGYEEIS